MSTIACAQQPSQPAAVGSLEGKSVQGNLTVTATVESSVGIVIGPNGESVLVVANAPAAGDNMVALVAVLPAAPPAASSQGKIKKNAQKR